MKKAIHLIMVLIVMMSTLLIVPSPVKAYPEPQFYYTCYKSGDSLEVVIQVAPVLSYQGMYVSYLFPDSVYPTPKTMDDFTHLHIFTDVTEASYPLTFSLLIYANADDYYPVIEADGIIRCSTEIECSDGNDDDEDGLTDCQDPDCSGNAACTCADGWCGDVCCDEGEVCCNGVCWAEHECCNNGNVPCSTECCNDQCCSSTDVCCNDDTCCPSESCCSGGTEVCPTECCDDVCCDQGQECCNGECWESSKCCNGETVTCNTQCCSDVCCLDNEVCCGGSDCMDSSHCCESLTEPCQNECCGDQCCDIGEVCCDGQCWPEESCCNGQICETECSDEEDNDGDGLTDCEDPDCSGIGICPTEDDCSDLFDNDSDGLVDCEDPDCSGNDACTPTPPIPEIATIVLIGLGLAAFGSFVWLRKRRLGLAIE